MLQYMEQPRRKPEQKRKKTGVKYIVELIWLFHQINMKFGRTRGKNKRLLIYKELVGIKAKYYKHQYR